MLRLDESHTRALLAQPETGMGYQEVEVTRKNNKTEKGMVYNAELLVENNEPQSLLELSRFANVLRTARDAGDEIKSIRVLRPYETRRFLFATTSLGESLAGPAKDAPVDETKVDEIFKRFSAYESDRRVTKDKGLLPGTYVTNEADAKNVQTGEEAVARYALPNPDPASYVYTIKPKKDTDIQRGTVESANGQLGGGVEAIFTNGTTADTVTLPPDKIPAG